MKYRNIKTGAIIEIKGKISGGWEPVEETKPAPAPEEPKKAPAKKKGTKK